MCDDHLRIIIFETSASLDASTLAINARPEFPDLVALVNNRFGAYISRRTLMLRDDSMLGTANISDDGKILNQANTRIN